jgi:hypothetical protein
MGGMNWNRPTTVKGTINHSKTSFSTEIFAGATIRGVRYLPPLRYTCQLVAVARGEALSKAPLSFQQGTAVDLGIH